MESTEIEKLAQLEDSHWWYVERRRILQREIAHLEPTTALDIGAAGGGNTRALMGAGWRAVALEYSEAGAGIARGRGVSVLRADARALPFRDSSMGLVVAFDVLEHVREDNLMAREVARVLRPGGTALIAVPADLRLWSSHDVAVGHVRRYDRAGLEHILTDAGLVIDHLWSWNVLLRPVASFRRRRRTGSDLSQLSSMTNFALKRIIACERFLPVRGLPGISLMARVRLPT